MAPRALIRVRAAARIAAAAIVAIVGLQGSAQPSAALTLCSTENCATIAVTMVGDGGGAVTSDDGNITCSYQSPTTSGTCGERVIWAIGKPNPIVTLTGTPVAGSNVCFGSGAVVCQPEGAGGSEPIQLSPGEAQVATFSFSNNTRTLTAAVSGTGQGTILAYSAQIICPATCTSALPYGWIGTFTATPSAGSTFKQWTGACAGQRANCQLTITADTKIDAEFDLPATATPTASPKPTQVVTAGPTIAGRSPAHPAATVAATAGGTASATAAGTPAATPATPSPFDQVLAATATPLVTGPPTTDPSGPAGSNSIPWLPLILLAVVVALAINALAFQVLRSRRPPR